jgi:predicted Zn-dependent protease
MATVLQLAHRVLDRATGSAGEVEAYVEQRVVTSVQAGAGGEVGHVGQADTYGVGVRWVRAEHVGYASTSDLGDDGLDAVVARAQANAELGDLDPAGASLPSASTAASIEELCRPQLRHLPMRARLDLVTDLARRATSLDPRIRRLASAEWRDEHRRVAVASTCGVSTSFESAFGELWCDVVGEDEGGEASDYGYWWGRDPDVLDVEALAKEAVGRTVRLLGPAASARAADTVVLDPDVAAAFLALWAARSPAGHWATAAALLPVDWARPSQRTACRCSTTGAVLPHPELPRSTAKGCRGSGRR